LYTSPIDWDMLSGHLREIARRYAESGASPLDEVSLLEICLAMGSTLELVPLLQKILSMMIRDLLAHQGSILLFDRERSNLEVSAERSGTLRSVQRKEGDDVKVGHVLAVIDEAAAETSRKQPPRPAPEKPAPTPPELEKQPPEPDRAEEQEEKPEVPPEKVPEMPRPPKPKPEIERPARGEVRAVEEGRPEERIRMSRRRRTIATRLVEAQHAAAMLTTFNEADMTAVMELRRRRKEAFEKRHGVGLGFTSFFVKASIGALKAFPRLSNVCLGDNNISDRGLASLAATPSLTALDLRGCAMLGNEGLKHLRTLKSLASLKLRGSLITDKPSAVTRSSWAPTLNAPYLSLAS
jgi:hypothetical protein